MNKIESISLFDILETQKLIKIFHDNSQKMYIELNEKYSFTNLLTYDELSKILTDVLGKENSDLVMKDQNKDSLFEDDIFCFAMLNKLTQLQKEHSNIKKYLSLHNMYKEQLKEDLYKKYIESL